MRKPLPILLSALALGCALTLSLPGATATASVGTRVYSTSEAGYSGTRASFNQIGIWSTLPRPSRFASQVGRIGISLQLWNPATVIDLDLAACTNASCLPGGRPGTYAYRPTLSIFNRATHALICSSSGTGVSRCPGVPRSWRTAKFRPGQSPQLWLGFNRTYGYVDASVNTVATGVDYYYSDRSDTSFNQARIVAQFGSTPWSRVSLRLPRSTERLLTLGIPPPPPYEIEFSTVGAKYGSCIDARWPHHAVALTGSGTSRTRQLVAPTATWQGSCDFGIDLRP